MKYDWETMTDGELRSYAFPDYGDEDPEGTRTMVEIRRFKAAARMHARRNGLKVWISRWTPYLRSDEDDGLGQDPVKVDFKFWSEEDVAPGDVLQPRLVPTGKCPLCRSDT